MDLNLNSVINSIEPLNKEAIQKAEERLNSLTKPPGSLGVLEELVLQLAGVSGQAIPQIDKKMVIVMAGDHGVVEEGISIAPQSVTPQMVHNFLNGGAAINVLARCAGAEVKVVDVGVADPDLSDPNLISFRVKSGTNNMTQGPAMTREEAIKAIEVGIKVARLEIEQGINILATGDMGIGNTTPSSAILSVYTNTPLPILVGPGTGLDNEGVNRKIKAIEKALLVNKPDPDDPLDVLAKVGGLEIAGLVGVILGAAVSHIPVVIDGFISGAAALIACKIAPMSRNYMIASHLSQEPGHKIMMDVIGLKPMLQMHMRLGEGTGAALAFNIIEAATRITREMATFAEAGVIMDA